MARDSGGKTQLPEGMKLKGKENYSAWQEAMKDLAISNDLMRFIHESAKPPKEIDEFDNNVDEEELRRWKDWEAGDSTLKLIIRFNCKNIPFQLISGCKSARIMWTTLQSHYEGSGAVLMFNAVETYHNIKYDNYPTLEQFIIHFNKSIEKLKNLDIAPPDEWHPIRFILAVSEAFPIWAERQRLNSRDKKNKLSLSALIEDLTDEARNRDKKAAGSSVLHNRKHNPNRKGKGKGKRQEQER